MRRFKGQVEGTVVGVVIVAVLVIIGALIYGYVRDAITSPMATLNSSSFNTTVSQVTSNAYSGFNLLSVAIIVMAAVAIIAVVFTLLRRR